MERGGRRKSINGSKISGGTKLGAEIDLQVRSRVFAFSFFTIFFLSLGFIFLKKMYF